MTRPMFTVALIGPDGAGKTTIARRLEEALPMPAKYLYMGVNWEASNHLLPTTRLMHAVRRARGAGDDTGGPPDEADFVSPPRPPLRRALRAGWTALALANRLAEEWYRQLMAWAYVRRGTVVVFDRHFFSDYHAHDVAGSRARSFDRRVHGFLLARVYPKPDLVIYLDAPAELLLARKGEGTLASLERRRREYFDLADHAENFVVVDATQSIEEVTAAVADAVEQFAAGLSSTASAAGRAS